MRYFIHIITDNERLVDPDGGEFFDLVSARTEAVQSARDLMAEELRCGRTVPFGWRAQVADEDGRVMLTLPFARLVFSEDLAAEVLKDWRPLSPDIDQVLVKRAKATFARARQSTAEIHKGLRELQRICEDLRQTAARPIGRFGIDNLVGGHD